MDENLVGASGQEGGARRWGLVVLMLALAVFWLTPAPLLDKLYAVGFGICPQRAGHSYFLGGTLLPGEETLRAAIPGLAAIAPEVATKLPVEARMYGMFAGFLVTWIFSWLIGRGRAAMMPKRSILFLYVAFIAVMGLDGGNATLYDLNAAGVPAPFGYEPRLDLRFLTGWLCGIAMAGIILPVVNYCLWRDAEPRAMFDRARDVLPLVMAGVGFWLLQTTGSGLFFYPLAVLAPLGIVAIFTALNIVFVLTLRGRERVARNWVEAMNPLALALALGVIELGLLSGMRWLAFGTGEIG